MSRILPTRKQLETQPVDSAADSTSPRAAGASAKPSAAPRVPTPAVDEPTERPKTEACQPLKSSPEQTTSRSPVRRAAERQPTVIMPVRAKPESDEPHTSEQIADEIIGVVEAAEEALTELELVIAQPVERAERMQTVVFSPLPAEPPEATLPESVEAMVPQERLPTVMVSPRRKEVVAEPPANMVETDEGVGETLHCENPLEAESFTAEPIGDTIVEVALVEVAQPVAERSEEPEAEQTSVRKPSRTPPGPQISPRRKRRQARRAARAQSRAEKEALATAAEIQQMLESLGPSVIECWTAKEDADTTVVLNNSAADITGEFTAPLLLVNDFVPQVIEIRVEVPAPPIANAPSEVTKPVASPVEMASKELASTEGPSDSPAVLEVAITPPANERLPLQDEVDIETVLPPMYDDDSSHGSKSADLVSDHLEGTMSSARMPTVELSFVELPSKSDKADHDHAAPLEDERTPTEFELSFQHRELPRRHEPETPRVISEPVERQAAPLVAHQPQVSPVAQGPRDLGTTVATQWETRLERDLRDPEMTASLGRLLDQWQRDGEHQPASTLLVASLGSPHIAAEVVMRAALQLVERIDAAVLVIDADADGALTRQMGLTGKIGLSDLIASADAHRDSICPTSTSRLHVLPRGKNAWPATSSPAALHKLLADLTHQYAWILAVGGGSQTPLVKALARECRATYVVAPLGELVVEDAQRELTNLRNAGARVLGSMVVRND